MICEKHQPARYQRGCPSPAASYLGSYLKKASLCQDRFRGRGGCNGSDLAEQRAAVAAAAAAERREQRKRNRMPVSSVLVVAVAVAVVGCEIGGPNGGADDNGWMCRVKRGKYGMGSDVVV